VTRNRQDRPSGHLGFAAVCLSLLIVAPNVSADWPTGRGNLQRTGSPDDRAGPKVPAVLWAFKAPDHFIASPAYDAGRLYVSGLGAFNTAIFYCLSADAEAVRRVLWSKSAPYLKLPIVCSPAVADGFVIFGDGMHQTDGAILRCVQADNGRPVWQLTLPGRLVHIEGSPSVDRTRVYMGAGDAGILCVDMKRVLLNGKEEDLDKAIPSIERQWAALNAKYQEDKEKDPQFAIPPSEDALTIPAPKLVWQKGEGQWHVDAPLAVAGNRVIAASAFVEDDRVGKRCVLCLNADDGSVLWEQPLKINPWDGPTVSGDLVIVGCSSIRFDRNLIERAQGEVIALGLADGQVRWRKAVAGGVLSPVAVKDGVAVFTATNGIIYACDATTGKPKWESPSKNRFFAGPAVAGRVVYAADLAGVLHAVSLADGKRLWTLDVTAAPTVQFPGMVFGSPIVQDGRVYLATCNLEAAGEQTCAVICVGEKSAAGAERPVPGVVVDQEKRTVTLECKIAPRKLPTLQEIYPLEVGATLPAPQGLKAHETVVTFEAKPSDVHKALVRLGLTPGRPARGDGPPPTGPEVKISLVIPSLADGKPRAIPLERTIVDRRTGKCLPTLTWYFTGSVMRQPNPNVDLSIYAADLSGTLITLFPVTDETVFQSNLTIKDSALLKLETNRNLLPEEGTPVQLLIEPKQPGSAGARTRKTER